MQQQRNTIIFIVLASLLLFVYMDLKHRLYPPPKPPAPTSEADKPAQKGKDEKDHPGPKKPSEEASPVVRLQKATAPTPESKLITLGENSRESPYHLRVRLDPRGAGARSILLNKFQAATDRGLPAWEDDDKKVPRPLELVPGLANLESPSFLLYHFDPANTADDRPLDTLGRTVWKVVEPGLQDVEREDGRRQQRVSFRTEIDGVVITKTYSLATGEYHLGLEITLARKAGAEKPLDFRYQLTGAHGLPVEGKWYTSTFRNALIGQVDDHGSVYRDIQDLRQLSSWLGGNSIHKQEGRAIRYAAIAVQYFASALAVDDQQKNPDFISQVRPTLEHGLLKGTIKSFAADRSSFVLTTNERTEATFLVRPGDEFFLDEFPVGRKAAVLYHAAPYNEKAHECPHVLDALLSFDSANPLWQDDITVRLATEPVKLEPGKEVTHRYLLYHGPVKVAQLLNGEDVRPELVRRYHDALHLNTLTDYHSPGWMGSFSSAIYWTNLLIACTNMMHGVLGWLHRVIPNYGLCILVLTILVRGMMFPLSRKQAITSIKMQQLAPELKKLQEKYKDDRQGMGLAQMELYRKHGVNPFGSCWVILIQMPVFMGLYYALQESIHFRLAAFWPTWIHNLAAPDMLFAWGNRIPFLSRPEDYGQFWYLGPYFNVLPVIAVIFMIIQQKMMTPPPADEQQAMQMKLMRIMMVVMCLAFYKMPAGLCIYFIASSLWGFAERRLLPRKQLALAGAPAPSENGGGYLQRLLQRSTETLTAERTASARDADRKAGRERPGRNRRRQPQRGRPGAPEEPQGWWQRARELWVKILEEARKK